MIGMKQRNHILACILLITVLTVPAFSLMLRLSLEELVENAGFIVRGKVAGKESRWDDEGKWIYTYVTVDILEYIGGEGEDRIVVKHPGGEVGKKGLIVGNNPRFEKEEEVLLFLSKIEESSSHLGLKETGGGIYRVNGLAQGKYEIETDENREKVISNSFSDLLINHDGKMVLSDEGLLSSMSLSEFVSQIREFLEEKE